MAIAEPMPDPSPPRSGLKAMLAKFWYPREYLLVGAFLCALGLGGVWGTWENLCAGGACPSIAQVRTFEHEQTSKVLSHDGRQFHEFGFERRTPVSINALPPYVAQAVVAVEDRRFYRHSGFDPRSMLRSAWGVFTFYSARTGQTLGGGSTITQQLARTLFEQIGNDRSGLGLYVRKFREIQVALDLERSYTKDQILEAYLNEIYMGRGYGFQNASENYLGKNLTDVNVAEAALLAAILNVPARYDPFRNPDRAKARRDLVLNRMADQGYITEEEAAGWKEFPLPESEPEGSVASVAPYFEEWVRQILDSRYGDEIYRGGYRIYTTLDIDMQRIAQAAMEQGWAATEADPRFQHPKYSEFDTVPSFPGGTPYLQGAFVALDPLTGHVKALVGGRNYEQSKFDRSRQALRQAGSTFKPFVYTAAIASGIPASHIIVDRPVVLEQLTGDDWRPANFDPEFRGPITIRDALNSSINMVAIQLGEEVGLETIAQTARRMGISTEVERFPSTTIGANEVLLLDLAEAYSSFPTLGTKVEPFPILRVENAQGEVIWEPQPERTVVLDSLVASVMVTMLEDVVLHGTGYSGIRVNAGLPYEVAAAGKTGTNNEGTDIWFAGFTPNLLATVWFGFDAPAPILAGGMGTGGVFAAPVWGNFMRRVYYGVEADEANGVAAIEPLVPIPAPFAPLPGLNAVLVDRLTGNLASRWCPTEDQYMEYYIPGTEPTELCDRTERRFRIPRLR